MRLFTIGHGTVPSETFVASLANPAISSLVDVRTAPGSRRYPWFARAEMERWLPDAGIAYRWEPRLGGFRKTHAESPHVALRVPAFRGYADHMETPEFRSALDDVVAEASGRPTVVMCSEGLWWRCHRRLLSDAATLLHGVEVVHIQPGGRIAPHRLTEGVRRRDDVLVYDDGQGRLV